MARDPPGLRPSNLSIDRPDNTTGMTGSAGNLLLQDNDKPVFRGGVTAENGDFSLYQHDLIESDAVIPLDDVGGASLVNITAVSLGNSGDEEFDPDPGENPTDASRPFTVYVEDLAPDADVLDPDEDDVLDRRTPEAAAGVERTRLGVGIFSDNGRLVFENAGLTVGENLINASINVQSGSTDAVQIRGSDGTIQDPDNSEALESLGEALGDGLEALAESRVSYEEDISVGGSLLEENQIISLDTRSSSIVDVSLNATDDDVIYELQSRPEVGAEWFDWITYDGEDGTGTDTIRDTVRTGSRFVRLVVVDQSENDDATATAALQASG